MPKSNNIFDVLDVHHYQFLADTNYFLAMGMNKIISVIHGQWSCSSLPFVLVQLM